MSQTDASEPPSNRTAVVVLAAGQGTRMRSPIPKVLHPVGGRPMIEHVLRTARALGPAEIVVVVSPATPTVREALGDIATVEQAEQLGTGHAVDQARPLLAGRCDRVLVLYGDGPLVRPATVQPLLAAVPRATIALMTVNLADPTGYGRIVRDADDGSVKAIVEEVMADPEVKSIREVWSGQMVIAADWLWQQLPRLPLRNQNEYYLTDLVEQARRAGKRVVAVPAEEPTEVMGINTQRELATANRVARERVAARLMDQGVTIIDPATTYIEADVDVAAGTVVHPNTYLQGTTRVGARCTLGPNSTIVDSVIGDNCCIWTSVVEGSELESGVQVGPFSHLRPGCYLERGVQLGNYAEAKACRIGRDTQVHHFSYLGDARIGERVNVGAGTITCNYDGIAKHRTEVEDDAFLGSDTLLVAPVSVGPGARTGAGAVVTRNVPAAVTVVGIPARPLNTAAGPDRAGSQKDGD